ncbi:ANKS3 [Symbiodinium sp. KB8]|nr:ANKS3 [Symbiodinium sp. KB8]
MTDSYRGRGLVLPGLLLLCAASSVTFVCSSDFSRGSRWPQAKSGSDWTRFRTLAWQRPMKEELKDPYEILGVDPGSTEEEIRAAYRARARVDHPDISDAEDAQERWMEISQAYKSLTDPRLQRKQRQKSAGQVSIYRGEERVQDDTALREQFFQALGGMMTDDQKSSLEMTLEDLKKPKLSRRSEAAEIARAKANAEVLRAPAGVEPEALWSLRLAARDTAGPESGTSLIACGLRAAARAVERKEAWVVFVCTEGVPSALMQHLPMLCALQQVPVAVVAATTEALGSAVAPLWPGRRKSNVDQAVAVALLRRCEERPRLAELCRQLEGSLPPVRLPFLLPEGGAKLWRPAPAAAVEAKVSMHSASNHSLRPSGEELAVTLQELSDSIMRTEEQKEEPAVTAHLLKKYLKKLHGFPMCIQRLVHNGVDLEALQELEAAVNHGNVEVVRLLLAAGMDKVAMVRFLLEAGAKKNARTLDGETCLQCASCFGDLELVRLLVGFGADLDLPDRAGQTALFSAAQKNQVQIVEFLLEAGSDPNRCNICGASPLIVASLAGHVKVVRLLVDAGVDLDFRACFGDTALIVASAEGHVEIVGSRCGCAFHLNLNVLGNVADTSLLSLFVQCFLDFEVDEDFIPMILLVVTKGPSQGVLEGFIHLPSAPRNAGGNWRGEHTKKGPGKGSGKGSRKGSGEGSGRAAPQPAEAAAAKDSLKRKIDEGPGGPALKKLELSSQPRPAGGPESEESKLSSQSAPAGRPQPELPSPIAPTGTEPKMPEVSLESSPAPAGGLSEPTSPPKPGEQAPTISDFFDTVDEPGESV